MTGLLRYVAFFMACAWCLSASPARSQALKYYYCYAVDHGSGSVYVSNVREVGPVAERKFYGDNFVKALSAAGSVPAEATGYCVMRATESEIIKSQTELRERCDQCGGAENFKEFVWAGGGGKPVPKSTTIAKANLAAQGVPETTTSAQAGVELSYDGLNGIGDALGLLVLSPLIPESENAAVQLRTKFFLCDGSIFLSYSLQPVPARKITSIRFRGAVTGPDNSRFQFDGGEAKYVPMHRLGCDFQKVFITSISRFGDIRRFKSTLRGSDEALNAGHVQWFLGLFFTIPYPSPWPDGSIGKPR